MVRVVRERACSRIQAVRNRVEEAIDLDVKSSETRARSHSANG